MGEFRGDEEPQAASTRGINTTGLSDFNTRGDIRAGSGAELEMQIRHHAEVGQRCFTRNRLSHARHVVDEI